MPRSIAQQVPCEVTKPPNEAQEAKLAPRFGPELTPVTTFAHRVGGAQPTAVSVLAGLRVLTESLGILNLSSYAMTLASGNRRGAHMY